MKYGIYMTFFIFLWCLHYIMFFEKKANLHKQKK